MLTVWTQSIPVFVPFGLCEIKNYKTGEEITNANPIDISINDKSTKFTRYELLWLSRGGGQKEMIIYKNISVPFHIQVGNG